MDYSLLKNAHKGIIYLFLGWMVLKLILMIVQDKNTFNKFRDKTKVVEMILGTLILVSGAWLFIECPVQKQGWLHLKMALAIIGIPIAIIGFKKDKVLLVVVSILMFLYVFWIASVKAFI